MNKAELIAIMAEDAKISKKAAEAALNAFTGAVEGALAKGDKVTLVGFGTFDVKKRAARTGRNPRTKEVIEIKAAKLPVFKAGAGLKKAID